MRALEFVPRQKRRAFLVLDCVSAECVAKNKVELRRVEPTQIH